METTCKHGTEPLLSSTFAMKCQESISTIIKGTNGLINFFGKSAIVVSITNSTFTLLRTFKFSTDRISFTSYFSTRDFLAVVAGADLVSNLVESLFFKKNEGQYELGIEYSKDLSDEGKPFLCYPPIGKEFKLQFLRKPVSFIACTLTITAANKFFLKNAFHSKEIFFISFLVTAARYALDYIVV